MVRVILALALLALSASALKVAQNETETEIVESESEGAGGDMEMSDEMMMMFGEQLIAYQVAAEEMQARKYLDLVVKLQTAYYQSTAAQLYVNKMYMEYQATRGGPVAPSFLEIDSDADFEEAAPEAEDDARDVAQGRSFEEDDTLSPTGASSHKMQLLGSLNLFHAVKLMNIDAIYKAHDLNDQFFSERSTQLKVALFGDMVPPEIVNLIYMEQVSTFLKINSLSLQLQTVSTFTTWLEDEIDLGVYLAKNPGSIKKVDALLGTEIADDRLWAFTAYNKYATLEMTIFCLDYYIQYQISNLMGPAGGAQQVGAQAGMQNANAMKMQQMKMMQKMGKFGGMQMSQMPKMSSFLELETNTETNTETKTKFYAALFAPFILGGSHQTYLDMYTFYQITMQYWASSAGLQSATAYKMAVSKAGDNGPTGGKGLMQYSKQMFGSFASSLQQVANVGYITSMWQLYFFFSETFGGDGAQQQAQGGMQGGMQGMGAMGGNSNNNAGMTKARAWVQNVMASVNKQ